MNFFCGHPLHAGSVMHYACVMFCPCPSTPTLKMYISETMYETESSFYLDLRVQQARVCQKQGLTKIPLTLMLHNFGQNGQNLGLQKACTGLTKIQKKNRLSIFDFDA